MPNDESIDSQYLNLARKYEGTVKMVARRYCHRDGYEYDSLLCTLTTHLWQVYTKLPADLSDDEEGAWIYSILDNKACELARKEQLLHSRIEYRATLPDIAYDEDDVDKKRLYELIDMLDISDRGVLSMYLEQKSLAEIGRALGGSRQRAIRRLRKIREKLRELNAKTE